MVSVCPPFTLLTHPTPSLCGFERKALRAAIEKERERLLSLPDKQLLDVDAKCTKRFAEYMELHGKQDVQHGLSPAAASARAQQGATSAVQAAMGLASESLCCSQEHLARRFEQEQQQLALSTTPPGTTTSHGDSERRSRQHEQQQLSLRALRDHVVSTPGPCNATRPTPGAAAAAGSGRPATKRSKVRTREGDAAVLHASTPKDVAGLQFPTSIAHAAPQRSAHGDSGGAQNGADVLVLDDSTTVDENTDSDLDHEAGRRHDKHQAPVRGPRAVEGSGSRLSKQQRRKRAKRIKMHDKDRRSRQTSKHPPGPEEHGHANGQSLAEVGAETPPPAQAQSAFVPHMPVGPGGMMFGGGWPYAPMLHTSMMQQQQQHSPMSLAMQPPHPQFPFVSGFNTNPMMSAASFGMMPPQAFGPGPFASNQDQGQGQDSPHATSELSTDSS